MSGALNLRARAGRDVCPAPPRDPETVRVRERGPDGRHRRRHHGRGVARAGLHAPVPLRGDVAAHHVPRGRAGHPLFHRELRLSRSARAGNRDVDQEVPDAEAAPLRRLHDLQRAARTDRRLPGHTSASGGRYRSLGGPGRRAPAALGRAALLRGPDRIPVPAPVLGRGGCAGVVRRGEPEIPDRGQGRQLDVGPPVRLPGMVRDPVAAARRGGSAGRRQAGTRGGQGGSPSCSPPWP